MENYYKISIAGRPLIKADTYELTYAYQGKVYTVEGSVILVEGFRPGDIEETWLSKKICQED